MTIRPLAKVLASFVAFLACILASENASAQSARSIDARAAGVIEHWTSERKAAAIPRDLVIDPRGLGYLRMPDRTLVPYGHQIAAQAADNHATAPAAGKPGSGDTTGPTITNMSPGSGATVGGSQSFSATVTDPSTVKSVTVRIQKQDGVAQSFAATEVANDVWSVGLSGLTDGEWSWSMVAKDGARGGGNSTPSPSIAFKVSTSGGGGGGGGTGTEPNAEWTKGGDVQGAVGRIYFEMPSNAKRKGPWSGYVCSGTVVNDATTGRSVILTASHCVYDDVNKAFARNVMFIPDQADTTGTGTDRNCGNDPLGCWVPSLGVVDANWTTRTFPDNVAWDFAFYVVSDSGAHQPGFLAATDVLDSSTDSLDVSFAPPSPILTHGLGYSYDVDPNFMYCADVLTAESSVNWWLANCGLSGGSSGGPWVQPMDMSTGNGPIISVNSWGYTNQAGMAGPKLFGTSASCVFAMAKAAQLGVTYADGDAGKSTTCQ